MDKKKIEELREQNKIIAKAIKEIIAESKTTEEKIYWTKKLNNFEACGDIRTRANGNNYVYNCREKFCCICQEKEKNKRFLKLYNEAFNISREKLETGYVEAFLTLNYNYNSKEFENLSLCEQIKFFKRLLNKFKKKAEKLGTIGIITKIEFPFLYNVEKFQIHAHSWICIEEKNIFQLQEIWKKITNQEGNLHIGSDNKEENPETSLYYRCGNKKRNGNISVKRICNYLAKHYISTALQSNNENEEKEVETQENRTCGTFEKIKNIEVLKQLIKATTGQLEAFQCLSIAGIYNKTNAEKERKKEKSRRFSVLEFDKKRLENNDDDCNIFRSGNDLLVEYKSNNNTIKAIERKFGGKVDTIKGKNVWGDAIELGDYTQVRKIGVVKKKRITKKQSETTKKTGVTFENFEVFRNIETIKQNIIRNGEQGKAWACEVVQELLPYTDTEVSRVKELERENNELREANDLLKIENIELMKENEILQMRNTLQNKRKAKQIKEKSNEKNKIINEQEKTIKELKMQFEATKKAYSSTERKEETEKEEQNLIIKDETGNKVEVIEYKMKRGGGYCYISKDKTQAFTNSCYCKKYERNGAFNVHEITEMLKIKGFEKFSEEFELEKVE